MDLGRGARCSRGPREASISTERAHTARFVVKDMTEEPLRFSDEIQAHDGVATKYLEVSVIGLSS